MQLQRFKDNRNVQFLVLNAFGWAGYGLAHLVSVFYAGKPPAYYSAIAVLSVWGFVITYPLRFIYRRVWDSNLVVRIIVVLAASYICSLLWVPLRSVLHWYTLGNYDLTNWRSLFWGVSYTHYVFISWSCLYFGIKFYQGMQEASQRALKATSLAHEAQLKMLRYQLNPHFLFNTLNAISTLNLNDQKERVDEMIVRLSEFLRYSLDNDPLQKVTLEKEITTLELYLGIEKVRFADRLNLDFQVEEQAKSALVPSLILQPLVENSVKYAIAKSEDGGTIRLRAKVFANELLLELRDTGPGVDLINGELAPGRGVGIRNTRERLKELYGDRHSFNISNLESSGNQAAGLQISIRLPYEVART